MTTKMIARCCASTAIATSNRNVTFQGNCTILKRKEPSFSKISKLFGDISRSIRRSMYIETRLHKFESGYYRTRSFQNLQYSGISYCEMQQNDDLHY